MAGDEVENGQPSARGGGGGSSYWQSIRSTVYWTVPSTVGALGSAAKGAYAATHRTVGAWIPDPESREAARRASVSVASVALEEASGWVPGGRAVWRMTKAGYSELGKAHGEGTAAEGGRKAREAAVERKLRELEEELGKLKTENRVMAERVDSAAAAAHPKPEDVIGAFVAGGSTGRGFLDPLFLSKARGGPTMPPAE